MPKKYIKNECSPEEWEAYKTRRRAQYQKAVLDPEKKKRQATKRRRAYNLSKGRPADAPVRKHNPKAGSEEEKQERAKFLRSRPEHLAKKRAYGKRPEVRARIRRRYVTDLNFRLHSILTTALKHHVTKQRAVRRSSVVKLLGLPIPEFRTYLEAQFKPGMSWANYGRYADGSPGWEIDHIRPCSSFNLNNESEMAACWHYSNMQPLWGNENRSKGNRL